MSTTKHWLVAILVLHGCGEEIEDELPDYKNEAAGWELHAVVGGNAPAHSDSIRYLYTNPEARASWQRRPDGTIGWQEGATIVKEVFADNDGEQGELRHIAVMRMKTPQKTANQDEGGWLFSETFDPKDKEKYYSFCWSYCHAAAPYNGAFYDYRETP